MAVAILYDTEQDVAVFFCTTSDEALPIQAFRGGDAVEQAEDFMSYLEALYDEADQRAYELLFLKDCLANWHEDAFGDDGEFAPTCATVPDAVS